MRYKTFGNATIYLGANIVNAAIPFLLLPILTRVLTPIDYGIVAMFGVVASILNSFTGLSVHNAVGVRYFQLESQSVAEYVGACLTILCASTALVFAVVAILGHWLAEVTQVPRYWLLVAVVMSGSQFVINVRLSLWQAQRKALLFGTMQVAQSIANAGISLYLVIVMKMAWEGRVLGQVVAMTTFMGLGVYSLLKCSEIKRPTAFARDVRDALKFGVPLIPHVCGGFLVGVADRFVVSEMLGIADVGVYSVAFQLGMVLKLVSDAFVKSYGPWLYERLQEESSNSKLVVVGASYLSCALFMVIAVLANAVLKYFFEYIVGREFYAALDIVLPFLLGQAFKGMYFTVSNFYFFSSRTHYLSAITLGSGIFGVGASICFVPSLGLAGAAYGFLLGNFLCFVLAWYFSGRMFAMPWLSVRSAIKEYWKYLGRPMTGSCRKNV